MLINVNQRDSSMLLQHKDVLALTTIGIAMIKMRQSHKCLTHSQKQDSINAPQAGLDNAWMF